MEDLNQPLDESRERDVRVIENAWIPMSDGTRLAARISVPVDAEEDPVPAILEYIPYRKRDHKRVRDEQVHGGFARAGYAGVRVDLRGSGDSEGVLRDEYLQQELDDGLEVMRWLAAQPWCSGKVGLFGLSWGGFNGLQLAALRPPELGAVISVCSSDDRYADDVHYMGGCLLTDNLSWASTMFGFNACPPDPEIVGERWRRMWLERLEGSGLWIEKWLRHQTRDDYWKHASVCEDYDAIEVPVFAVSGWADGYSNTVFRLMKNLKGPRRGLVGAWGHKYPHMGGPGPTIDFINECILWWDRWLKGVENGIEHEPKLRVWMQDPANPMQPRRPGRWVAEADWPAPEIEERAYQVKPSGVLTEDDGAAREPAEVSISSPLSTGLFAGKWCSFSEATDLPWDQREEDGGALVFETAPLETDLEILGQARVEFEVSADKPIAQIAVRLSDVAPNDRVTRVTFGVLNLTHRDSHETPEELQPGRRYRIAIDMNDIAQRFAPGHRIRLSVSSSYWPLAWPAPEPVRLSLHTEHCRLILPVRAAKPDDDALRVMGEGRSPEPPPTTMLAPPEREFLVTHNLASNEVSLNVLNNDGKVRIEEIDMTFERKVRERYSYRSDKYDTVRGETVHERSFQRGDWRTLSVARTTLTSTRTHFLIRATLDAYEGDVRVFSKSWDEAIPRDHV